MYTLLYLTLLSSISHLASGQFPPPPKGVTTIPAASHNGAALSYKQTFICETTPGVKSYAGYVHLPSSVTGESYNSSVFYWYFPARKCPESAPLSIYLAGGPGESSMDGVAGQTGPCTINPDSNSTTINPWSFNNEVNMLYIDQPVQVGFSYDTLVNGTLDLLTGAITPMDFDKSLKLNKTTLWGTFPSQNATGTTLGSERGASVLWDFMQVFVTTFPKQDLKNKPLSIWGNSWAGFYITATFTFFARQNTRILAAERSHSKSSSKCEQYIPLNVMGLTNGCIDPVIEAPMYPVMATANTYNFTAYNSTVHAAVLDAVNSKGGCLDLSNQCRELSAIGDPSYAGTNATVNAACAGAFEFCYSEVQGPIAYSGRSAFDIAHPVLDPFPPIRSAGYFNNEWVQAALGVHVNYTDNSAAVVEVYVEGVGDAMRSSVARLEEVLNGGYKVAMMHGDRDTRCNWLGGEAVSLAAKWAHKEEFSKSGYAELITNKTYIGGYVRQTGDFSFTRIFQGGHAVEAYQPETIYRIFTRSQNNLDIATGKKSTARSKKSGDCEYHSIGPLTVRNQTSVLPPLPPVDCYTWNAPGRCAPNQLEALAEGKAVVKDFIVVKPAPEADAE